jgi:hypothetical protein
MGTAAGSMKLLWAGRVMSDLPVLFLLFAGTMNPMKPESVVNATVEMGHPEDVILPLGIVLLPSNVLYIIPRTSVLGAVLLTGYLGGAVATHVRAGDPILNIYFPIVFGVLLWGGLWLRDGRLRALLPLKHET